MLSNSRYGCDAVYSALVFPVLSEGAVWWDAVLVWVVLTC